MKKVFFTAILIFGYLTVNADVVIDDFDANSFGWNECAYESNSGKSIIDQGVLTVTSKGENKAAGALLSALSGVKTQVGENTFFETHCYSPLDVTKDFKITADVTIDKLGDDKLAGLVFNYKDGGNFYCFTFNDEMITFNRYRDNSSVGKIQQGVKWSKNKKLQQQWRLEKEGDELAFFVDDMEIMRVRYMPVEYCGVGFYTFGKQKLIVDSITYEQ